MGAKQANFNGNRTPEPSAKASYRPDSVIPESHHSDKQKAFDGRSIAAMAVGRLMQRNAQSGELEVAERYWALSRTRIEDTPVEDGPDTHEIVGGWVTREQAILELTESNEPVPATVTNLEDRRAA